MREVLSRNVQALRFRINAYPRRCSARRRRLGLEAVNQILGDFSVPVIFITGYPERFLTGTRPEPAFLITKPFRLDSLKAIISQALFFDRKSHRKDKSEAITLSSDHTGRGESMFPCLDHSG
jgi:DNA-binding LytR/AlgR family response regulator